MFLPPPRFPLFPYTTLFRSLRSRLESPHGSSFMVYGPTSQPAKFLLNPPEKFRWMPESPATLPRSEEHTSELQSPCNLVCRLLLEQKKKPTRQHPTYPRTTT